jgi:DNA-binding transcriptional MerR regulator
MWETRYELVKPERGPGGQRLYSDADVAVIRAVTTLIARGYGVGEVASWSRNEILDAA